MHDIDLTRLEDEEMDDEEDFDEMSDLDEIDDESFEFDDGADELPFDDEEELELAAELLEIENDEEFDEFLGKVFRRVGRGIRRVTRSKPFRRVFRGVKRIGRKILPIAGGALGNLVAPGIGGKVGAGLGSFASKLFELEAEGMDEEDLQMEIARRYIRLAGSAAKRAASAPPGANPQKVAASALRSAARQHMPGVGRLDSIARGGRASSQGASGRWVRRGRNIVLLGV